MLGVPIEFLLFAFTLLGVALFHHRTLEVAVSGLAAITLYKLLFRTFPSGPGVPGWPRTCRTNGSSSPTSAACCSVLRCCRDISRRATCR